MEHLAAGPEGWIWQRTREGAFVFPEYDGCNGCKLGEKCRTHAACVAKALGGLPVVLSRDAEAMKKTEVVTSPLPEGAHAHQPPEKKSRAEMTIGERIRENREQRKKWRKDPSEVFEETERRAP